MATRTQYYAVWSIIHFLEGINGRELDDGFENYAAGLWSRANLEALIEDLKGQTEKTG